MNDDDPTRMIRRTPPLSRPSDEAISSSLDGEDPTRIVVRRQQPNSSSLQSGHGGMTKVYYPPKPEEGALDPASGMLPAPIGQADDETRQLSQGETNNPPRSDSQLGKEPPISKPAGPGSTDDPVVGWVVIVAGPGRGCSRMLGQGMNQIGRDPDQEVALDFGDEGIYRKSHAQITYDPQGRKFYANHGGQRDLTYLGGEPLLQATELKGGEEITLGGTTLRFIPFCGENFQW